jgi:hypothetical protein
MKKFAFCALVAALVLALAVPAICETKIGGSYRIRGVYWDQGLDKGKFGGTIPGVGRYFDNRLRLNIDSEVTDTLAVHVEADSGLGYNGRNGDFQNPAATPDSYDGIWNSGGRFINVPEPLAADRDVNVVGHDIVFQQAYMDFATPIGAFSLGRQWSFWGMGLMVGENRNRLAWSYQMPEFQIGAGYDKFFEGDTNFGAFSKQDDQDNYFVWALYEGPNFQLGPYFEYTHADRITTLPFVGLEGVNVYGVSIYGNATFGPLALAAEFAYRGGTADVLGGDIDFNSYAGVVRGTYELPYATVGGEGGYISGQDPSETDEVQAFLTPWSFSPFAVLGELAINGLDLLGNASYITMGGSYSDFCSNMIYGKAFAQASPIPKLDAYVGVGYAVSTEDVLLDNNNPLSGDRGSSLGAEIDLSLTYAITPNLTYNFTGGYLFVGDFYDDANLATNIFGGGGLGTAEPEDAMLAVHSITVNW